ncbi:hypothetical protein [uncultured Acetobacteroides sp.]|uniref:hypothetical protein n=1 Tax=uncultured Acetobacteroides sp. TaxID=1760811 RepID=UPI0029F494EA|nr:hypothetical protein [uncultured Acetobacteroides sp.]
MKNIFVIVALLAIAITGSAQEKYWNIGIGGGAAFPVGDAADYTKMGVGACLTGMFCFSKKFRGGVEFGYASLRAKTWGTLDLDNTSIRALLLKGDFTFTEQRLRPYVALFLGFYSTRVCKSLRVNGGEETSTCIINNNYGYGVEAGVRRGCLSVGVAYNVVAVDFKYVLVSLGYTFVL